MIKPRFKTFDGQKFELDDVYRYKGDAGKVAAKIRRNGFKARVVSQGGGYAVYFRQIR